MTELLRYMVVQMVQKPDEVRIVMEEKDGEEIYKLSVAPEEMGKIIGKGGRTARDLRYILRASGGQEGKKVNLEIVE